MSSTHQSGALPHFPSLRAFLDPGDDVAALRKRLYRSDAPGYVVVPGFVEPEYAEHVRRFWVESPPPAKRYASWNKPGAYPVGHPPMRIHNDAKTVYWHLLWNEHPDEVSLAIALAVGHIRNAIEGCSPHVGLVPNGGSLLSYRVIVSRHSAEPEVSRHNDEISGASNLTRLASTLVLSEYGRDYQGEGFEFWTNPGECVRFGPEVKVLPGDLILWRHKNDHQVGRISTPEGGSGFVRMLFPLVDSEAPRMPEPDPPPAPPASPVADRVILRARQILGGVARRVGLR